MFAGEPAPFVIRVKEARRKGAKPKLDRVDRYLAGSGAVHDEIMAMRREVAMRY